MIDRCLEDRILLFNTFLGAQNYEISSELMYDNMLTMNLPKAGKLFGYACDVALLVDQSTTPLIEIVANDYLS